jgi:hypothetical protein
MSDNDTEIIRIIQRAKALSPKETNMANDDKIGFFDQAKIDAADAAYRVAAKQITSGVRTGLVLTIKAKGGNGDKAEAIGSLLESEFGEAIVHGLLGMILPQVGSMLPGGNDARLTRLSKEFRTSGMATVGNAVIGELMEYVLPAITNALKALPELPAETGTGVRVGKSSSKSGEEDTTVKNGKVMGLSS